MAVRVFGELVDVFVDLGDQVAHLSGRLDVRDILKPSLNLGPFPAPWTSLPEFLVEELSHHLDT